MISKDEDAVACDLAETYGIFDYRQFPADVVARLAAGLRPDARIIQKMSGIDLSLDTLLLAAIADRLAFLAWTKTKDANTNTNRPGSILKILLHKEKEKAGFDTPEEFEAWRKSMLTG